MENLDNIGWLNNLFLRFGAIYGGLWSHDVASESGLLLKRLEWYGALAGFRHDVINSAINLTRTHFDKPPSIKEFVDLCNSESRRLKPDSPQLENKMRPPPSPLLAEYMAKHPQSQEELERFKKQFKGKEFGTQFLKMIRDRLPRKGK